MNRKKFLKNSLTATIGSTLLGTACNTGNENIENAKAPNIITNKKYQWRMLTTWPPNFPIFGELANDVAKWINTMSGDRINIKIFAAGELVPSFEAFEAVSSGTAEMCSSTAYYWAGKAPATVFFTGIPFGMNTQQLTSWLMAGEGYKLWKEVYAPFNVIPFLGGNTGMQPAGWFNKPINSISDLKGLKVRIGGFGGKALEKAGAASVLLPGSEIYTSLERGVIDAAEWVGPYHDYKMGFHKIAKYYYTLGWHETTGQLEYVVNKKKYEALPRDLQEIITCATQRSQAIMQSLMDYQNGIYIGKIRNETSVEIGQFPEQVIEVLRKYSIEAFEEETAKNATMKKVYDNYRAFQKTVNNWTSLTEKPYYNLLQKF